MDNLHYIRGTLFAGALVVTFPIYGQHYSQPVNIQNYVIPAVFANALYQGMNVPVFIRYHGDSSTSRSQQKIADALLTIHDGAFQIKHVTLNDAPDGTELAAEVKKILGDVDGKRFEDGTRLHLTKDAALSLDTKSFYLELTVSRDALAAAILPRSTLLGNSTADSLSNILNYTIGSYYNKYDNSNSASSFITIDNTLGWQEHHVNLNGSLYGVGIADRKSELYRAMYERDYRGHRMAAGMVDTWNLQSIASMSALNSGRIYGMSYGNKSSSQKEDNTLSLTPITVFLPAAGEIRVYRDRKLMSIQDFPMGSFEVDTSRLPFGVYDVEIEMMVNGRVVSKRSAQVNKTFARKSSVTDKLSWQVFGGMLTYNNIDYRQHRNLQHGEKETWLAGVAVDTSKPWLGGVNMKNTLYGFDNNGVSETEVNVAFNDMFSVNQQALLASDSSWRSITTLNLSLPAGYGNLWGSREISHVGSALPMQKSDYYTAGATANLNKIAPWLGSFTISRTRNNYTGSTYTNADYNQSLYTGRYATVMLRTGVQRYRYGNRDDLRDKYVNLDVSLPLATWLSADVSSENGTLLANTALRKRFDTGPITQVGASLSKRLSDNNRNSNARADDFSTSGYLSYDTKYNAGTVAVTRTSDRSSNVSLNSQGSVAWTKDAMSLGKGTQTAGLMVNTNFSEKGQMVAQINGRNYPLTGKRNYISLPPYAEYKVELMNDKHAEDSVDIVSGRTSRVVLYPGNISVITLRLKQLVTVFGRVRKPNGAVFAHADIKNHIGKTRTDEHGEFAMDVAKRYPTIVVMDAGGQVCETDLELRAARDAVWIGDVKCKLQRQLASHSREDEHVY